MTKIVVSSIVSVDGYTEGPGGDAMAMPMDLAFADHNAERAREARSFLFGATTYRAAVTYWPTSSKFRTCRRVTTTLPSGTPTASRSPWSPTASPSKTPDPGANRPRSSADPTHTRRWHGYPSRMVTRWSSAAARCGPICWRTASSTSST